MLLPGTDALQSTQVDQNIDQGVEVGDRGTIAELGALDAEICGLGIDAFGGRTLLVQSLVGVAVPVELVTDASADAGGEGGLAAALGQMRILNGTGLTGRLWEEERTDITALLVWDQHAFANHKGELEGHG